MQAAHAGEDARDRLMTTMPGLAWTLDRELRFTAGAGTFTSPPATWDRVLGLSLFEVYGSSDRSRTPISAHIRALAGETVEYNRMVEGRELRVRVQPIVIDGRIEGVVGLASDLDATTSARAATQRRVAQQEVMARLSVLALREHDIDVLLSVAADLAAEGLEAESAGVAQLIDGNTLVPRATHNLAPSGPVPTGGPIGELLLGGADVISNDLASDLRFDSLPSGFESGSLIVVPIRIGSGIWGTLAVRTQRMRAFSPLDLAFVNCLANTVSAALEWRELDATRRSLEEQLHQAQRLDSLGRLAGGIAHDFNNLLGVILSYSDFVAQAIGDNERVQADIAEIRMAAGRASALSRQLLIFGRGESVQAEVLDLNEVVAGVDGFPDRMIVAPTQLAVHPAPEPMPIRVDRGQLEQMLINLLVNASDAMPDGGEVTIETRRVEGTAVAPGPHVELAVSDSGVGMTPDVAARAFEPFFTTKRPGEGAGLGLAIVYGIVAEAGGNVTIHSELGIGTTVEVSFPAIDDPARGGATPREPGHVGGHGETVLVVEDEPAILGVAARILRRNGYAVIEADSGPTALELAERHDFDLLLTDCVMPQMSGRVLADRLQEQRAGLRVVFMSGYSDGILGTSRQVDDDIRLIEKPFNEQSLLEKVHDALVERA